MLLIGWGCDLPLNRADEVIAWLLLAVVHFGHHTMSDLSPECMAKRTSAQQSEFMRSRLDDGGGATK
jgi:hypothetical protein